MAKITKQFVKQSKTFLRYFTVFVISLVILLQPLQLSNAATDPITIKDVMPKPAGNSGTEFYAANYRGVMEKYLPIYDQLADGKYKRWSTTADIEEGLELFQETADLNPYTGSLLDQFLGPNTKVYLAQEVLSERSNNTDLWWGTFDNTVQAASVLNELGILQYNFTQLDTILNYTLQLADYYSTLAPKQVTINNITMPGWTQLTLFDLLQFRISSFLASKTFSLDKTSDNYYNRLDDAIGLGLVSMKSLNLVPLSSEIIQNKDKNTIEYITGNNFLQNYTYQLSNYSQSQQGVTDEFMTLDVPTFYDIFPGLFDSKDYYQQQLQRYHVPVKLDIKTTEKIPDTLISYQNYQMHLIYYSNRELVSYNVTVPHDAWNFDDNGSLIYVTNKTIETRSYYKPIDGVWTDNYTFVPSEIVSRGMWVFNTSVMDKPDSYRITLSIPNFANDQQTFSVARVQGDTIDYETTLPIQNQNSNYKLKVTIEQLSTIGKELNGTRLNEEKLAELYNKTAVYNNQTYYFENGIIDLTLGSDGLPIGGIVVNKSTLEHMAQEPTYDV